MKKIKLGDLFELKTSKGLAYLHFIYKDDEIGELVRVLPQVYEKRPIDLTKIASEKEKFMVYFPLSAAKRRKIVEHVGHYKNDGYSKPEFMRTEHNIGGKFLGWHIVDTETWQRQLVENLTLEQKKFSPWGIWNDTLLIEKIVEDWKLEDWG